MSKQHKFPLTQQFPMPFSALMYPSPQASRGVTVRGQGHFTLTFEPTKDANIAQVRFEDFFAKLDPCRIPFDIDGDGMLECLELDRLQFGKEAVDLDKSGGEYNLENKHIQLKLVFTLGPKELEPLISKLSLGYILPVHFDLVEQGWLDLETGHYATHSRIFTVPDGPFAGLTILGGWGDEPSPECYAMVALGVSIVSIDDFDLLRPKDIPVAGQAPKNVWICPNTPVILSWAATNAESVDIQPDIGLRSLGLGDDNFELISDIDTDREYTVVTVGSCVEAHDAVYIHVLTEDKETPQTAGYNRDFSYWVTSLPTHCYDSSFEVQEVIIDTDQLDSVRHDSWRLDHVPTITGTVIDSVDRWYRTARPFPLPGEYRFTPITSNGLPPGEEERILYFRLKGKCERI